MMQLYLFVDENSKTKISGIEKILNYYQDEYPHQLHIVDTETDTYVKNAFKNKLPVLDIGSFRIIKPSNETDIQFALHATQQKILLAEEKQDNLTLDSFTALPVMTKSDRFSAWFSKHYMLLFNLLVLLYVGLPILAPVLMKFKMPRAANVIYKVYSPLCHQLAYRSFFLFGEQLFYPRELAGIDGMSTYEDISGFDEKDLLKARNFLGNEEVGYKTALCQRDLAIYLAILIFGLIFSLTGNKIKTIPWYVWVMFGIIPIGIDGFSQLISQLEWALLSWFPVRESTPLLRFISGSMFGFFTAWYGYPYMEESISETRLSVAIKRMIIKQTKIE